MRKKQSFVRFYSSEKERERNPLMFVIIPPSLILTFLDEIGRQKKILNDGLKMIYKTLEPV